ncbi:MAG TPA: ATP-binding protein, partial [Thermoanaerobaculaceae bacterium]|nr:ATP-binding protein [Thermoanaerobaculaceae bacterium]
GGSISKRWMGQFPSGAYIWGVEDGTHNCIGTTFLPFSTKKGNEPLETWLLRLLEPKIHFRFFEATTENNGTRLVVLEIGRAFRHPVRFHGEEYVRVGQVKKPLKDVPDRERDLWRILDWTPFEDLLAAEHLGDDEVVRLLDAPAYFDLLEQPLPATRRGILECLSSDYLIRPCSAGGWEVTNLGAILFAKRLADFPGLQRKAVRVIQYRGKGRIETLKEQAGIRGYASGFEGLISFVNGLLPSNEVIGQALRRTLPMFPELAVRELIVNALIHQDFFVTGAGPMVEIFEDRIEITNPGEPLVDTQRFVDTPPRSRNEKVASMMRRFRICEERGSGIDKVVSQVELFQLPAPLFERPEGSTKAVLFSHKPLSAMDRADRVRACYLHACLCYVTSRAMTNTSVRKRFGIAERNAAVASRLLSEAVEAGLIVVKDPTAGTRSRTYLPYWAGSPPAGQGVA